MGNDWGRVRRSQVTMISRVSMTEVNREVRMPMARVTPKPFTGP